MGTRKARGWCDICRDEKPDVTCIERDCRKSFHIDCLRNTGQRYEDDDFSNYLCPSCRDNEENDAFCYKCKSEGDENSTLLMCDGCPRSAHLECLGLKDVPTADIWMCPVCVPASTQPKESTKLSHSSSSGRSKLGNVDICYVCQKGGKLLCCDVCDQSFHPKCIDPEFLEGTLLDEGAWSCPICRGEDPLKNMGHKRLTRAERQAKSREWQQCVRRESRRCRANRDQFLYESRDALRPFVSADTIARLKRSAAAASKQQRQLRVKSKKLHSSDSSRESSQEPPITGRLKRGVPAEDSEDEGANTSEGGEGGSRRVRRRLIEDDSPLPETTVGAQPQVKPATSDASAAAPVESSTEFSVVYQEEELLRDAEAQAAESKVTILREGVELKHYQRWGVNWLLDAFYHKAGAILADEMGLGKTIQTLAFLSALKVLGVSGPHLVVVPLSTVGNWAREIRKFTTNLSVTKICGSRQEREHAMADGVAMDGIYDIFVTTYETAVTEEWFFTDRFKWQCVILDEAHRIKNESARIRHSLDRVECNMRVLLTGTPLQNNIKELFTLLNFLFPDIIKDSSGIEAAFATAKKTDKARALATSPSDESSSLILNPVAFDESKVGAVTSLLSKLMLRRTKDLVVRLPSKIEHDIWLPLSPTAALWYRRLLETTSDTDDSSSIRKLLGAVIKMRICCCHPRGLVSRDDQLRNLLDTLSDSYGGCAVNMELLQSQAQELREIHQGWKHICMSTKLIFLDKLLRQLHSENMAYCESYRADYETQRSNRIRKLVKEKRESLEALMNSTKQLPVSEPVPAVTVDAMMKLERELTILAKPAREGGGLDGLIEEPEALLPPAEDPNLFLSNLLPVDATPEHYAALKTGGCSTKKEEVPSQAASSSIPEDEPKTLIRPHKVLVFTQFQLVLDELSAYCAWRGWSYMRLDGSTNKMIRELDTREFNSPDSNHFVYLISTRAGGLGINLVTANHVVMYDEDWNPFVDLQAVDRAHRIGQVRSVHIWRLMLEWTVEERMAIRRQQKLKLDRLLIQANVENMEGGVTADADAPEQHQSEKLSTDEIRRLIQYGRTALMRVSVTNELEQLPLEAVIHRKRRELREVEEFSCQPGGDMPPPSESSATTLSGASPCSLGGGVTDSDAGDDTRSFQQHGGRQRKATLDIQEAMRDVEGPRETETLEDDDGVVSAAEGDESEQVSQSESTLSLPTGLDGDDPIIRYRGDRPRRERRKPKTLYNPTLQLDRYRAEIKITREKKCFRCGGTGTPAFPAGGSQKSDSAAKKSSQDEDKGADVLVGCMRCPKVYHLESCLGLQKVPPRTWMCPWHECCLCFRRAASAGGLLIHCAECPTAFCFDCFPPEYRRYTPAPQFFEELQKRGWMVTPQKLVTFLCSKCKALKEQERRRHLTKQQLDAEMKTRKSKDDSARLEARKRQQQSREERMLAKDRRQKQLDERKKFLQQKKTMDEADKELQDRLRHAVESLYPKRYLELLRDRRQYLLDEYQQVSCKASTSVDQATVDPSCKQDEDHHDAADVPPLDVGVTCPSPSSASPALQPLSTGEHFVFADPTPAATSDGTAPSITTAIGLNKREEGSTSCGGGAGGRRSAETTLNEGQLTSAHDAVVPSSSPPPSRPSEGRNDIKLDSLRGSHVSLDFNGEASSFPDVPPTECFIVADAAGPPSSPLPSSHPLLDTVVSDDPGPTSTTTSQSLTAAAVTTPTPNKKDAKVLKKRFVVPDRVKHPGDTLKLCENCQLPMHDLGQCPFPLEIKRQRVEPSSSSAMSTQPKADSVTPGVDGPKTEPMSATPLIVVDVSDHEGVGGSTTGSAILKEEGGTAGATTTTTTTPSAVESHTTEKHSKGRHHASAGEKATVASKAKYRVLCALCLDPSAIPHARKHCEKLSDDAKAEYASRREKYVRLIELLEKEAQDNPEPIPAPTRLAELLSVPDVSHSVLSDKFLDGMRRQLSCSADAILQKFMRQVGLEACLPKPMETTPAATTTTTGASSGGATLGGASGAATAGQGATSSEKMKSVKVEKVNKPASGKNAITSYLSSSSDAAGKAQQQQQRHSDDRLASATTFPLTSVHSKVHKSKKKSTAASATIDSDISAEDGGGVSVVLPSTSPGPESTTVTDYCNRGLTGDNHFDEGDTSVAAAARQQQRPSSYRPTTEGDGHKKRKHPPFVTTQEQQHEPKASKKGRKDPGSMITPTGVTGTTAAVVSPMITAARSSPGVFRPGRSMGSGLAPPSAAAAAAAAASHESSLGYDLSGPGGATMQSTPTAPALPPGYRQLHPNSITSTSTGAAPPGLDPQSSSASSSSAAAAALGGMGDLRGSSAAAAVAAAAAAAYGSTPSYLAASQAAAAAAVAAQRRGDPETSAAAAAAAASFLAAYPSGNSNMLMAAMMMLPPAPRHHHHHHPHHHHPHSSHPVAPAFSPYSLPSQQLPPPPAPSQYSGPYMLQQPVQGQQQAQRVGWMLAAPGATTVTPHQQLQGQQQRH